MIKKYLFSKILQDWSEVDGIVDGIKIFNFEYKIEKKQKEKNIINL